MNKVTDADILQWVPLVQKMASSFHRQFDDATLIEDLKSVGSVGVWEAIQTYNGTVPLKSWVAMLIRQHMAAFCEVESRRGMKRVDRGKLPRVKAFTDFAYKDDFDPFETSIEAKPERSKWSEEDWAYFLRGILPNDLEVIERVYFQGEDMKRLGGRHGINRKAASALHARSISRVRAVLEDRGITRMEQVA